MSSVQPEIHDRHAHAQVTELAARRAPEQAWKQFAQAQTPEEFCGSWLIIQCHTIGGVSDGVVIMRKPGTDSFAPVAFYPESPRNRLLLAKVSERALKEGRGILQPQEGAVDPEARGPRYQLAYPVRLDGEMRGVVGMDIDWRPETQLQAAMRDLQWGSGWLEVVLRRHADPVEAVTQRLKLALGLIATLLEHPGLDQACAAFTTELATRLGCDRATLGVFKGRRVKIRAVSHSAQFERRANLLRAVADAMEEAIDQGETVVFPPEKENLPVVSHAHQVLLRESEAGSAATLPLTSGGRVVGALTLERAAGFRFDAPTLEICEAVASLAGPIVELKRRGDENLPERAAGTTRQLWERLFGPRHAGFKLTAACVAAVALFLAFATGDFRVSAASTVEGVVQRAITAPFNGYVKESLLRAGDTVKSGLVIGRFDDRDLRLERARLASQRDQYVRQHREALAKRERAQAEIVGAQLSQSEAQLALVDEQLARVDMVAPFDGVIVSGDLSQSLGSPVERGQVLFEIAPLDSYRIALRVDERDIAHVALAQRGELAVASMPQERFGFTISKITSVNTAKEGANYFRVEANLERRDLRLRPGMEGVGKIYVDQRKLIWIWTRTLTDWVRLRLWSWLP
ncbi:MAG TPA: HlyD family efflux transporter periplasmic adaptor subunit [Burkholderiales bacterium]|nr:HlyD family efflux transporter periplasmic adaptor subunit [Burkholderiales bacterium]